MHSIAAPQVCFLTALLFSSETPLLFDPVLPGLGRHFVYPRQPSALFFAALNGPLNAIWQHRHVFTSGIASDSIQCAFSVLEYSPRGLLVTPRANAIPPKYINIFYEFCLARQRHDVSIAAVPESCSTTDVQSLSNLIALPNLIQKFDSDAVFLRWWKACMN